MADLCTPLLTLLLPAIICTAPPLCQPPTDGIHSICQPGICRPPPPQYDCVRADQTHYIWEPPDTEGSAHSLPAEAPGYFCAQEEKCRISVPESFAR